MKLYYKEGKKWGENIVNLEKVFQLKKTKRLENSVGKKKLKLLASVYTNWLETVVKVKEKCIEKEKKKAFATFST